MTCIATRQPHRLLVIATSRGNAPGVTHPVRWCQDCGAVVVDTDVDGRVSPGDVWPMTFPTFVRRATVAAGSDLCSGEVK